MASFFIPVHYLATTATVVVKMPDGTACAGKSVMLNGKQHTTNAKGEIILTGDKGDKEKFFIKYSVNYWTEISVVYDGLVHTANLVEHAIAGSVSVPAWDFVESSNRGRAHTFVVPSVVKVIKITGTGFDGYDDEAYDSAYVGLDTRPTYNPRESNTIWYAGTGSFTRYIGVTAGKTYTIYGRWVRDAVISWSDEINKMQPNHTSY